jgi:methylated-DNA-[protein]-cysteine S-methyltransferase
MRHLQGAGVMTNSATMAMDGTSEARGYCLFDTAIGACGLAWSEHGVTHVQLPEASRDKTEQRLRSRVQRDRRSTPTPAIDRLIADLRGYLEGRRMDFRAIRLDLEQAESFDRRVYDAARTVGWGETVTYGDLARLVGATGAAREIGQAMSRNPVPIIVPCHRILARGNKFGGFSAFGGVDVKARLLALEGLCLL